MNPNQNHRSVLGLAAAACLSGALVANAQVVKWTFETSPPADLANSTAIGSIAADVGTGTASGFHASAATDWSTPAGNGSANSLSSNTWAANDYYQFQLSSSGLFSSYLQISWDQTRSSTGPTSFKVQYSVNGTTFTDLGFSYTVPSVSWSSSTPDATGTTSFATDTSSIGGGLINEANVYFRLVSTVTPAAGGTSRVDNFTVTEFFTPVPEPSTYAGIAGGLLLGFGVWRRATQKG